MKKQQHKPIIETIINTTALALTSYGILQITGSGRVFQGYVAVLFGMALEYFKYIGRDRGLW
tara:strand:- start:3071 stop:3256 length:186 start_codon:yes stop_codon:yes gene_type:complete